MTTTSSVTDKTYYEILGIDKNTATDLDIKKAYRKLALKYHPDRSSEENNKELATAKFQEIGEAYNCLSDMNKKREYDHYLKYSNQKSNFNNNNFATTTNPFEQQQQQQQQRQQSSPRRQSSSSPRQQQQRFAAARHYYDRRKGKVDPFQQFDYVFRTDPFFHDAFKDLDDEFARRFQQQPQHNNNQYHSTTSPLSQQQQRGGGSGGNTLFSTTNPPPQQQQNNTNNDLNEGWFIWLLRQCGIQFQVSSYTTDRHGNISASHYSSTSTSSSRGGNNNNNNNNNTYYTKKVSQTYVDNQGRHITIKQMQRGPNSIQDKYLNGKLIERRVNGQIIVNLLASSSSLENY